MANRFYSEVSVSGETRVKSGKRPASPGGSSKNLPLNERTASWPKPNPIWKDSFNCCSKVPVVTTRAAKHGIA